MGLQTKTIGRMPTDHGPYDPQLAYGEKFVVTLFGCGWESKENNNTSAPATLNEQTGVITPNANWIKRWGSYEQWLIDNGYKKVDAANVKDGNHTQHEINNAVANEIGTNSTPSSIKGRVTNLESAVGSGGSVDSRIASAVNTERNRAEGVESGHNTRIEALETAVGSGGSVDSRISSAVAAEAERAQAAEADRYTKSETYTKTEVNGLVDTPHQEYVTVDAYSALPATGSKDTVYRVSNYNGSTSQVDASVYSEYAWNGSQYIFLCVKSQVGEVFDISAYNNNAKYADLAAALNGGANIPQSLQKGGMSVKFVQSSDNKYYQYRLMKNQFSTAVADWQGVDVEIAFNSKNLVDGGGIYKYLPKKQESVIKQQGQYENKVAQYNSAANPFEITESDNYALIAPIELKKGETIKMNLDNTFYHGSYVVVLFECDSNGDWIRNIEIGSSVIAERTKKSSYTNTGNETIYVGTCTYVADRGYIIESATESVGKEYIIKSWISSESFTLQSNATYTDGIINSPVNIVWPDGTIGTLTITRDSDELVTNIVAVYGTDNYEYTITRDSNGNAVSTFIVKL